MTKAIDFAEFPNVVSAHIEYTMGGNSVILKFKNGKVLQLALDNDAVLAYKSEQDFDDNGQAVMLGIDLDNGYAEEDFRFVSYGQDIPVKRYD